MTTTTTATTYPAPSPACAPIAADESPFLYGLRVFRYLIAESTAHVYRFDLATLEQAYSASAVAVAADVSDVVRDRYRETRYVIATAVERLRREERAAAAAASAPTVSRRVPPPPLARLRRPVPSLPPAGTAASRPL